MKVSVIIPAYNEEGYIAACLQSLIDQEEQPEEIIVVNNNSIDKTVALAKQFPVKVVNEKQQGMIHTRNKGFNSAQYEIIARTDADARVPKTWIKQIKKAFKEDKALLAYSGPARFYKIPKVVQVANWQSRIWFYPFKEIFGHDSLLGPNMAIRKSAWEKVKNEVCLVDQIVHEDMDLAYHIGRYGKVKSDPKHIVSMSPRRFKKVYPYLEYGYRTLRTIQHHKYALHPLKNHKLVRKVISKKLIRKLSFNNRSRIISL